VSDEAVAAAPPRDSGDVPEPSGATEGIGDQLTGGEGEGRVDSSLALGDQMGPRGQRSRVELREPIQRGLVGRVGEAEGDRNPQRGEPVV
jgi:hypothetical protein